MIKSIVKTMILKLIRLYQKTLSLDHGVAGKLFPHSRFCRFTPSCSEYTYEAIEKYGVIRGGGMGIYRVLRCNPFNKNCGYDPVQ